MTGANKPPDRTGTVIIGAGIVGCSTAYHLAQRGRGDVTVLDAGPIPKTGGSSVHAPGGLFQTTPSKLMANWAQYTRELYTDLGAFDAVGGIEIATTDERMEFLDRRMDQATAWGIDGAERLTPAEVADRVPLVDPDAIRGGFYVPTDGRMNSVDLLDALRQGAEDGGIEFHEHRAVTDVETANGGVKAVVTDRGRIACDELLVAGNIWAPLFGEMVDVEIPLTPCEHQYAVTDELDVLSDATEDVDHPFLRHQDAAMYFRQHRTGYGIGSYNHEPLLVDPHDIDDREDAMEESPVYDYVPGRGSNHDPIRMPSTRPFTEEHFGDAWAETVRVLPDLDGASVEKAYNGMFCFTPDGMPILGEAPSVDGFWVAAAVWLTHAGGVGRTVAEMMDAGSASENVVPAHINRFQPHSGSETFVRDRGYRQYDTVYDVVHPRESAVTNRGLRTGPFYGQQSALDAEFYEADGWERARWYGENESLLDRYGDQIPERTGWEARFWSPIEAAEHLAVRDGVGLFDLSNFTTIDIEGSDAAEFAQRAFTNDMAIDVGDARYTLLCNPRGNVLGDMTVVRLAEDRYHVLANSGAAGTEQLAWLREQADGDDAVSVTNRVSSRAGVGVWGPDARELLAPLVEADLANDAFPYFSAQDTYLEEIPVTALRVSYVGELGWELHTATEYGRKLWEYLWEAGQEYDAVAMGDGALDTMRLEKGFRLYGTDLTTEYDPFEAGLGFAVDMDTEFVGREALTDAADGAVEKRLACLTLDDTDRVPTGGAPVLDGAGTVGYTTSVGYGYSVGAPIAYGYVSNEYAEAGTSVAVQYENERYPATVREEPLFDPERERILG
ncbi:GcvT family protein [Halomicrococcus gelatinilyticus]|uniref:GcvT family protein n=1 Tax=Halomicrococcus gelatinilyticus TaxID=1702103 RepID=UPI002E0FD080